MPRLSVITITKDEERNILECLESVRWADQLVVVDSGSSDRTVELARTMTPEVHCIDWEGYGKARNFALDQATGEWVLWLDADERVTPELAEEIRGIIGRNDRACNGYSVARRAYFLGKWIRHCGWYPSRVVRLFRRSQGKFSETRVHERLELDGPVGVLKHDLLHFTDRNLRQYLTKFNKYTTLAAEDMAGEGRRFRLRDLLVRPPFLFFKMYVLRLGFLDGVHGLVLSILSSAYVFTKYAKLWELTHGKND